MKRAFYFVAILFGILVCLTDCSKNGSVNGNPIDTTGEAIVHVSKIRINDSGALLLPSLVKQLSVTITPATAFNIKINWRCSDNAVATVDGNGMVTGILPVVGVPLPFVSYGGTSFVTLIASFGILMSIQTHRKLLGS